MSSHRSWGLGAQVTALRALMQKIHQFDANDRDITTRCGTLPTPLRRTREAEQSLMRPIRAACIGHWKRIRLLVTDSIPALKVPPNVPGTVVRY